MVIYSAPKIESDIIHRGITRVGRAINILAHTIPAHAEGLHCLLELSQLTSSNAALAKQRTSLPILKNGISILGEEGDFLWREENLFVEESFRWENSRRIYRNKYRSVFSGNRLNSGIRNLFEKVEMISVRWIFYCIKKLSENCEK